MDKGVWQATVHGVTRVRHDLATKEREKDQNLVKHDETVILHL